MGFERISKEEWLSTQVDYFECENENYDSIILPSRGTNKSAGYDFRSPFYFEVIPEREYIMPTGIKWNPEGASLLTKTITYERSTHIGCVREADIVYNVDQELKCMNLVLKMYPRSSLGMKYGFVFSNTTPIIDADYYNNPGNEGHIFIGFKCSKSFTIKKGDKICQGIMVPYLTFGEGIDTERTGGIGSTGK